MSDVVPGAALAGETFNFTLTYDSIMVEAFERCRRFRDMAGGGFPTQNDMASARRSLQLELATWANRGVNLWEQNSDIITLQQGVSSYTLTDPIVSILDVWYTQPGTSGESQTDRILWPLGRSEYAMY